MDAGPVPDRATSRAIGVRSYALLYSTARALLETGSGLILESNFPRDLAEGELAPLVARARTVMLHCTAPDGVLLDRYVARAASGTRHPGHFDAVVAASWDVRASASPLTLDVPLLVVDTTEGYAPPFPDILAFVLASA